MRPRALACALGAALVSGACAEAPPRRGELLLVVDTDVAVPELGSRLRVDTYSSEGAWIDSREVFLGNAAEWPASMSFVNPDDRAAVTSFVRLRLFPEGATRRYGGERWVEPTPYQAPTPATSREELCASPPPLPLGGTVTLRRGREAILPEGAFAGPPDCMEPYANSVGSVAARFDVATPGSYHFGVVATSPTLPAAAATLEQQVTLQLREACADDDSNIACSHGVHVLPGGYAEPLAPAVHAELEPGTYFLVSGGVVEHNGVADITLAAWSDDVPIYANEGPSAPPPAAPTGPFLRNDPARTPADEPEPALAIDRIVRVTIEPHAFGRARVVLRGDCLGRRARLAQSAGGVVPAEMASCTDGIDRFAPPQPPRSESSDASDVGPSLQGTFATGERCTAADSDARFVCVPSGAFVLGTRNQFDEAGLAQPQRSAAIHRFWIDRAELTVANYREATQRGFALGDDDLTDNGNVATSPADVHVPEDMCTWSTQPLGREDRPLTCISWYGARAFCQFRGGDLPTSAAWEYAALRAGHARKSRFPWGDNPPVCSCDGTVPGCRAAVFERGPFDRQACLAAGFGAAPAAAVGGPFGDESPLGIVGLAGNVREWTLDGALPLDHPCFSSESPWDPICAEPFATARLLRATSFIVGLVPTASTFFWQPAQTIYDNGVRCTYAARPSL